MRKKGQMKGVGKLVTFPARVNPTSISVCSCSHLKSVISSFISILVSRSANAQRRRN